MRQASQAVLIIFFLSFIMLSQKSLAYNFTVNPSEISVSAVVNKTSNTTFNLTNYGNPLNITFISIYMNFTPSAYFSFTGNTIILADINPFSSEGSYSDNISVIDMDNNTSIVVIPVSITVGSEINYFFKKCFLENNTEFCAMFNISDVQNVTILNITNVTQNYSLVMPFDILQEYLTKKEQADQAIRDSIINASNSLTKERSESEKIFMNSQIVKGFLKNNLETWIEIKPVNFLNITGLNESDLAFAIKYLESNNEITSRVVKEDLPYVIVAPPDFKPQRAIMHTQIALTDRKEKDDTWFYAEVIVGVVIALVSIFLVSVKLYGMYKGGVRFRK